MLALAWRTHELWLQIFAVTALVLGTVYILWMLQSFVRDLWSTRNDPLR